MMPSLVNDDPDEKDAIEEYADDFDQANDKVRPPHYQTFGQAFDPCKEIVNSGHSAELATLSIAES